ncbi:DNA cytosine methyltransferase [Emticicia sp. BO119]|uniref:DNA cytosine methyltransferase n=1 Tax=Emticicia sp. BO119 TaxID=2757768 RepID=UPI0015F08828|nr:DNA cytosine methyltransferase [Emticicia sp. BO119]MBA4849474.1 DNA cytosine methyltransferase [Emticicia sp. BO119]
MEQSKTTPLMQFIPDKISIQDSGFQQLVLSLFPNIGMLDSGFVRNGFTVVTAPDKIVNGEIRDFKGVPGRFDGIIGGSPCQDFSGLNRNPGTLSQEMLDEYKRIVRECQPDWFLLENVTRVPDVEIEGYYVQRFNLSPTDLGFEQSRNRTFQFGTKDGRIIELPEPVKYNGKRERCVTASEGNKPDRRTFEEFCKLQGFTEVPELGSFTKSAKYQAIGNGVHLGVSYVIARYLKNAIFSRYPKTIFNTKVCACGCGRIVSGRKLSYNDACRKRVQLKREVTWNDNSKIVTV